MLKKIEVISPERNEKLKAVIGVDNYTIEKDSFTDHGLGKIKIKGLFDIIDAYDIARRSYIMGYNDAVEDYGMR